MITTIITLLTAFIFLLFVAGPVWGTLAFIAIVIWAVIEGIYF